MAAVDIGQFTSIVDRWTAQEDKHQHNVPLHGDDNFDGPLKSRSCTDIVILILFLLFSVACGVVVIYYFIFGDPNRLDHGFDFRAELCGVNGLKDAKYTYFVNPAETTNVAICLSGCPVVDATMALCLYDTDHKTELLQDCYDVYESKPYFNRYCLPADPDLRGEVDEFLDSDQYHITLILGDIYRGWSVMGVGTCIASGIALLFIILIRFSSLTFLVVYAAVLIVGLEFAAIVFFVYKDSERVDNNRCGAFGTVVMEDCNSDESDYKVLMYVVGAIELFLLFVIVLLIFTIRRAANVFKASLRPLRNVLTLLIIPLFGLLAGGGILTCLVFSLIYGGSVGNIETITETTVPGGEVKIINFFWRERYILIFVIGIHLWWLSFVSSLCEYLVASIATFWFFSKDKAILSSPVTFSLKLVIFKHMGSIALGSILLPMFRVPRVIFSGLKGLVTSFNLELRKCFSVSCFPCLLVHENFLKYLVEDAYVYQIIWASSFFTSAKKSYFLVKRSTIEAKSIIAAAHTAIWLLQIVVFTSGPIFTYYWVIEQNETFTEERTHYISWATELSALTFIGSAFAATVMGGFFRGLVHASVHCLLADSEMFVGSQRFADAELLEILHIDKSEKNSATNSLGTNKVVPVSGDTFDVNFQNIETARGLYKETNQNQSEYPANDVYASQEDFVQVQKVASLSQQDEIYAVQDDFERVVSKKPAGAYTSPDGQVDRVNTMLFGNPEAMTNRDLVPQSLPSGEDAGLPVDGRPPSSTRGGRGRGRRGK